MIRFEPQLISDTITSTSGQKLKVKFPFAKVVSAFARPFRWFIILILTGELHCVKKKGRNNKKESHTHVCRFRHTLDEPLLALLDAAKAIDFNCCDVSSMNGIVRGVLPMGFVVLCAHPATKLCHAYLALGKPYLQQFSNK